MKLNELKDVYTEFSKFERSPFFISDESINEANMLADKETTETYY